MLNAEGALKDSHRSRCFESFVAVLCMFLLAWLMHAVSPLLFFSSIPQPMDLVDLANYGPWISFFTVVGIISGQWILRGRL